MIKFIVHSTPLLKHCDPFNLHGQYNLLGQPEHPEHNNTQDYR